jgi:Xaa-Pro aminopeptidase
MISRRRFLGTSSLALAGSAVAGCTPASPESLPPSIAALTSQADRPRPITTMERQDRVDRAVQLMEQGGIDALMLTGGTSLRYFTNISWGGGERLFTVIIPRTGRPFLVCPAFEEERAGEQLAKGPLGGTTDIRTWQEHESPWEKVAAGLRDLGLAEGRVAVEETVQFRFSNGLAKTASHVTLVSGDPITAGCRVIKDAHEIELMRLASEVTLAAYKAAYESLEEGMTQNDFAGLVSLAHTQQGFSGGAGVQVGEYSALPHGSIMPQVVREGTILLIDGGCSVEGYRSDISRTFVLGKASERMKDVFEIELAAQSAALAAAGPGVPAEAVDAAARNLITDAGFGPDYKYFTHRVGHGMGMDGHEWPYLVKGNTMPLEPGMTFSDEPGIYIRGEFGIRLEDDMLITENGAELFTAQSRSLEDPFA